MVDRVGHQLGDVVALLLGGEGADVGSFVHRIPDHPRGHLVDEAALELVGDRRHGR